MKNYFSIIICTVSILINSSVFAQTVPFNSTNWEMTDKSQLIDHLGEKAIRLHGSSIELKNTEFQDGIIE